MFPWLFLKTPPYPTRPGFPLEAPSKLILMNLCGGGFHREVEAGGAGTRFGLGELGYGFEVEGLEDRELIWVSFPVLFLPGLGQDSFLD
jgi:hypothetical protein